MNRVVIVSACLAGMKTNYEGGDNLDQRVAALVKRGRAIPVCPEQLGGLPTPRDRAEIVGGHGLEVLKGTAHVVNQRGEDVTANFLRGAEEALRLVRLAGADHAVFKSHSPSCGCGQIYDGTFTHKLRPGDGVAAALLRANGISVVSEEDWDDS